MTKAGERLLGAARNAAAIVREERLQDAIAKARARYEGMTPEEKFAHDEAQRQSWVRGMMATGDPRFD